MIMFCKSCGKEIPEGQELCEECAAKEAETADMYIEKVTHNLATNNRVRVVTSDGLEQLIILGSGALRIPSRAFKEEVQQAESDIRRIITEFKDNKNKP